MSDPEQKCDVSGEYASPAVFMSGNGTLNEESSTSRESTDSLNQGTSRADRLVSLEVELRELLGKGSYGMVYRATTPRHGEVAVKVLPWAVNEVSSELKKELKLLQRCNSAYIVRAFGAFAKPKELWIVMEYCNLGSLLDVMRSMDEPLPEGAIAAACADSARGLVYMHTQKRVIIHRDIKSANILLNCEGRVKLADFGVAAQLNSTASKRNSVIGTPHWMAPEVISNGKYDARADVWSLGITAIELAQGRPPHHEMRPVLKVLFAIASGEPPQLDVSDTFSESFRAFIGAALTKEMEQRPVSSELLKHPFLAAAQRSSLLNLAERAIYYKSNPKPRAEGDPDDTLRRGENDGTLERDDGTLMQRDNGTMTIGDGTFCAGDTGDGTFCAGETGGGTFCAGGTGGGTFCAAGSTVGGTFCAAGSPAGGMFCAQEGAAGAAQIETGGTLPAGAAFNLSTVSTADLYHTCGELTSPPTLSKASSTVYPVLPPIYPVARAAHGGSMDDSQLNLSRLEGEDEAGSVGSLPRLTRAASDDALFERAVSRFGSPEGKSRPQLTRPHTGSEALPGEEVEPNVDANCTVS